MVKNIFLFEVHQEKLRTAEKSCLEYVMKQFTVINLLMDLNNSFFASSFENLKDLYIYVHAISSGYFFC